MLFVVPLLVAAAATPAEVSLVTIIVSSSLTLAGLGLCLGLAPTEPEVSSADEPDEHPNPSIKSVISQFSSSVKDALQAQLTLMTELLVRDFKESNELADVLHRESEQFQTTIPLLVHAVNLAKEGAAILLDEIKKPLADANKAIATMTTNIERMIATMQEQESELTKIIFELKSMNDQLASQEQVISNLHTTISSLTQHALNQADNLQQLQVRNQLLEDHVIIQQNQKDCLHKTSEQQQAKLNQQQVLIKTYVATVKELNSDLMAQESLNQVLLDALQHQGVVLDYVEPVRSVGLPNHYQFFQPLAPDGNQAISPANSQSKP